MSGKHTSQMGPAVFYHTPMWNWNDLPSSLTESSHMVLDRINDFITTDASPVLQTTTTTTSSGVTTTKMTTATHIYHLQKQIEDTVAKCRTLAFFTNDTKVLEEALAHCEAARPKLATSITSAQDHGPPIYTAIEIAGVEELKNYQIIPQGRSKTQEKESYSTGQNEGPVRTFIGGS